MIESLDLAPGAFPNGNLGAYERCHPDTIERDVVRPAYGTRRRLARIRADYDLAPGRSADTGAVVTHPRDRRGHEDRGSEAVHGDVPRDADTRLRVTDLEVGVNRIMFSADYPYGSMSQASNFLDQLPVSPADNESIAHENAELLLRL